MDSQGLRRFVLGRRTGAGRRRLLITGTPGTGKRQLGGYLAVQRGFLHVDLDNRATRASLLRSGEAELRRELAAIAAAHRKVVVTWTFSSETQLPYVAAMRALGFEWIWTDSDRGAAFDALVAAGPHLAGPRFVDPFEPDGRFRPFEAVTAELRGRRALPRPRLRPPVPALPRPAWAALAAGAVAAATAGGALLAGALGPAPARAPAAAAEAHHRAPRTGTFPVDGVLVRGKSLAGVRLGDTEAEVRSLWGRKFTVCQGCRPTTWFYWSPTGDPFGAGITFRHGRVTAVFTLGTPEGWHTSDGIRIGQLLQRFNDPGDATTPACNGYGAISTRTGETVTSILTSGQAVYGFALTRPSEPVCH